MATMRLGLSWRVSSAARGCRAVPPRWRAIGPGWICVDEVEGIDAAVLVDALRSGVSPGSVRVLSPAQLERGHALSSHALGVADALALAEALGRRRPELRIVAVELEVERREGGSAAGRAAVPEACRRVRMLLAELTGQAHFETD
jgi:hydrogenase maturation protease